jgi:DNA-binding transcriptional regulator YbjK
MTEPARDRRAVLADAGIALIAKGGARALTHRAVDAAAGLPAGSTSYYFRTRRALLEAVAHRLADLDRRDSEAVQRRAGLEGDADHAEGAVDLDLDAHRVAKIYAAVLDGWLATRRERTLARYACLLEAAADPRLHDVLDAGSSFRRDAAGLLARAGVSDPDLRGRHLVAFLDGLLFDRLAGAGSLSAPPPGTPQSRRELADAIRAALLGLSRTTDLTEADKAIDTQSKL